MIKAPLDTFWHFYNCFFSNGGIINDWSRRLRISTSVLTDSVSASLHPRLSRSRLSILDLLSILRRKIRRRYASSVMDDAPRFIYHKCTSLTVKCSKSIHGSEIGDFFLSSFFPFRFFFAEIERFLWFAPQLASSPINHADFNGRLIIWQKDFIHLRWLDTRTTTSR